MKKGKDDMAKQKKTTEHAEKITELTADLQRTRADFENYRKRVEEEISRARTMGEAGAVMKLLPVIDVIERAISHAPEELRGNAWAEGVIGITKQLNKVLAGLNVERVLIIPGETEFDPELHEAVSADGDGNTEVVAEELQPGYKLNGQLMRHAMVRVARK